MKTDRLYAGVRVARLRREQGLTQVELARRLAISPSYLNQIEHDSRPLSASVLVRLSEVCGVDAAHFATGDISRRLAELREALATVAPTDGEPGVPAGDVEEVARAMPEMAAGVAELHRRLREAEESIALAAERGFVPAHSSPHEQVRDFFYQHNNYVDALDRAAEDLVRRLGTRRVDVGRRLREHLEEAHGVRVVGSARALGLDRAADPGGSVEDELHRYDEETRTLHLAPGLRAGQQTFRMATEIALLEQSGLIEELVDEYAWADEQARALGRIGLANHFAGALVLPYEPFYVAAERMRYDVEVLAEHFGVSYETIAHRLSTLQRPRMRGVPFLFVRVDRAGNISKRQSATAFHFSRSGGTCPLWNVYEAFATPGRVITQVAQMPDASRYLWVSHAVQRRRAGYGGPAKTFAIGLGCETRHASRLVYSDGLDVDGAAMPIGPGCRACERHGCPQRSAPTLGRPLQVDERRSTFAPYPT